MACATSPQGPWWPNGIGSRRRPSGRPSTERTDAGWSKASKRADIGEGEPGPELIEAPDYAKGLSLAALGVAEPFGTLLADPPWRFANRTGKVTPEHRRLSRYDTMTANERLWDKKAHWVYSSVYTSVYSVL